MAPAELRPRPLDHSDVARVLEIKRRSFGPSSSSVEQYAQPQQPLLDAGRMLGVVAGDQVVAAADVLPMHQVWHGRPVPMAGIAGVVVAPELRGRGVGTLLMRAVLDRARELGAPLSALYPATVPIYRHLGWEFAGMRQRVGVPSHLLRVLDGHDVEARPATPGDAETVLDLERRVYERGPDSGPLLHTLDETKRRLDDVDVFTYVTDGGFVMYGWHETDLLVHQLVAEREDSLRALWSVVGSGASTAPTVHAYVAPRDPLHLLLPATAVVSVRTERWMLGLLDLPAAVTARGFPPGVTCEVPLRIVDREVHGAGGAWLLRVSGGAGVLERSEITRSATEHSAVEHSAVELGARAVAALYAGTPVGVLRRAGLVSGGSPDADAALNAAFAGDAYLLDYF